VSSANKAYIRGLSGRSIYSDCLDGKDINIRLDVYMNEEQGGFDDEGNKTGAGWKVEYCYLVERVTDQ